MTYAYTEKVSGTDANSGSFMCTGFCQSNCKPIHNFNIKKGGAHKCKSIGMVRPKKMQKWHALYANISQTLIDRTHTQIWLSQASYN